MSKTNTYESLNRIAIFLGVILCVSCAKVDYKSPQLVPPNILLILVDDLGKEWVSCYGAEDITTPNIDRLAQSGIKFNHVYGMPQCTPSRVTLLTGQYPFRHGWINHWDVPRWGGGAHFDETMNPSLAVEMKKAGYKTCITGKWQIDDFRVEPDALTRNGFDDYCMWTGYESGNPPSSERYHDPYVFTKQGSKRYENAYGPDLFKDFICEFIRENRDTSMFIYFPMVLTHVPFEHTPIDSAETDLGKHQAMVTYTDLITGEILRTLEETGIRDNTLIIWTTDNGTTQKITGTINGKTIRGGKMKTTEPGVCLPFIASWPAVIKPGQTSNALIDFSDLFPTFLDLAGISVNKEYTIQDKKYHIDGVSFKQVLTQGTPTKRDWILSMGGGNHAQLTEKGVENQYVFRDRVIRNEHYKLYINSKREVAGFFELGKNLEEGQNLLDSLDTSGRAENFKRLCEVMSLFPEKDHDPIYSPNPPQEWDVEVTAKSQIWKY
ncbi:MAG: sulfatase-like hydrolase/transferase [Bacteroidota bacterium]